MLSQNDKNTYSLMTYSIQAVWINMFDSHNDIKTFVMTYSIQERWWSINYVSMSFCLSFVIIRAGYLGDYSPPFGGGVGGGASWWVRPCCSFFLFLYRVPTIILLIFFLFSFFLFKFVPIIKEIRTINRMILRTKHLLN